MAGYITSAQLNGSISSKIITKKEVKRSPHFYSQSKDFLNLSDISKVLNFYSINTKSSSLHYSGNNSVFDIDFFTGEKESLNLNGNFSRENHTAEFNLNYYFEKEIDMDGKMVLKPFQLDLGLQTQNIQLLKVEKYYEKEDILKFVRRLTNEILEISLDKKKSLKGIILNSEDLSELNSGDTKSIGSLLQRLIYSLLMLEQLKDLQKKNKNQESITIKAERKLYEVTEKELKIDNNLAYSASLNISDK